MIYNTKSGRRIKPTKDSEDLIGRLRNCKFESAKKYMKGQPKDVQACIRALARLFDNNGWVEGDVGFLVGMAVDLLVGYEES
jgi:hypothetical protein